MELALYRKYRPQTFLDVREQSEIISVLARQALKGEFGHAYLFCGGRGTGKTTIARIFAKSLDIHPEDIYEMDAASNRQIDDIRELREAVKTLPFSSKMKCYIIDEAHMLTKEAFNALLKTLEEPPSHVLFILATTDREKIPATIASRCQSFTFKQPSVRVLAQYVADIAKNEGYDVDGAASELVAIAGDGSYRDALSTLEKVLSIAGDATAIKGDMAARVVGAPRHEIVNRILRGIDEANIGDALLAVRDAEAEHVDSRFFMRMVLMKMRAVLLVRYAPDMLAQIAEEYSPDDVALVRTLATSPAKRINSHTLLAFLGVAELSGAASIPTLPIEIAVIRACGER